MEEGVHDLTSMHREFNSIANLISRCSVEMEEDSAADEAKRKCQKPVVSLDEVREICEDNFGFSVESLKALDSYDDCNFMVTSLTGEKFLLKYYNGVESLSPIVEGYSALLRHVGNGVAGSDLCVSMPVASVKTGSDAIVVEKCKIHSGENMKNVIRCRLFKWVHGDTMFDVGSSCTLLVSTGHALAIVTKVLVKFDHSSFHRTFAWDLRNFSAVKGFVDFIDDADVKALVIRTLAHFDEHIVPASGEFRQSVILGDCNDANVIVNDGSVSGLIDVGDAAWTWTVNDVAVCMAYGILSSWGKGHPREALIAVAAGYCSIFPLRPVEASHLLGLVRCRLAMSITYGAFSLSKDPDNDYLKIHAVPAREKLAILWDEDEAFTDMLHRVTDGMRSSSRAGDARDGGGSEDFEQLFAQAMDLAEAKSS